jgi:hypothetical protein
VYSPYLRLSAEGPQMAIAQNRGASKA